MYVEESLLSLSYANDFCTPSFLNIVEDHHWYDVNVLLCVCGLVICSLSWPRFLYSPCVVCIVLFVLLYDFLCHQN